MVTQSEGALTQAQVFDRLKEVAFGYLAKVPAEWAFWAVIVVVLVGLIVGVVMAVKALKSAKRLVKGYAKRISHDLKRRASGSKDERFLLDQVDRLRRQNWRGIYAKVHMGLCLLTSGVGIALAAQEHAAMAFPVNLVAFVAFEGLAVAIMMRIEDRAKQALPYRSLLVLYWGTIGVAAVVQTTHVDNQVGQVIWAAFTLSGGLVYHLHMATLRADKETELRQWEERWLKRKMDLGRWLRPIEALQVVWEKAADTEMSTDEATRRVRERRADRRCDRSLDRVMWSVWRLGRAKKARRVSGVGWLVDWVESNHLVLTQKAIANARLHADPAKLEDLLRRLEAMDLAGQLSGIRSRSDARLVYGSFAGGSAAGSVGRLEQFALPSAAEPKKPSSGDRVRMVFVGESAGSGSQEEFESADSGSAKDFSVGSTPTTREFEPQDSRTAIWEYSEDGWTPPTVDQAWERAAEDEPTLFDHASTTRRVLPLQSARSTIPATLADPEENNVRRVRTMDELRYEVKQAWDEGRLEKVSSEQIYRTLQISKRRAADLRDWLLRQELRSALARGQLEEVSPVGVAERFGIMRKQADKLLVWAEREGLVAVEAPATDQVR